LRDADANDAPDEGEIAAHDTPTPGRVRILTIHGAKGLEAPIVWLLGANDAPRAGEAWDVIVDWPPAEAAPSHFSFFGRKEDRGAARQPMFEAEAAAAEREELNLLYVAITRARQVFIASGIEERQGQGSGRRIGCSRRRWGNSKALPDTATLPTVAAGVAEPSLQRCGESSSVLPAIGERRQPPDAAERFGILLHALLEKRSEGEDEARRGQTGGPRSASTTAEFQRVLPVAERLLARRAFAALLRPSAVPPRVERGRVDRRRSGALLRLDRLVESRTACGCSITRVPAAIPRGWTIIGAGNGVLPGRVGVFPERAVRGALIFADGSVVEVD
jgi:ATP-dependent helicase/nuclease subunit A